MRSLLLQVTCRTSCSHQPPPASVTIVVTSCPTVDSFASDLSVSSLTSTFIICSGWILHIIDIDGCRQQRRRVCCCCLPAWRLNSHRSLMTMPSSMVLKGDQRHHWPIGGCSSPAPPSANCGVGYHRISAVATCPTTSC